MSKTEKATGSKFDGLFPKTAESPTVQKQESPEVQTAESPVVSLPEPAPTPAGRTMGRPKGRKSDKDAYRQVTVYLPIDLHDAGRDLVHELSKGPKEKRRDFSGIVEDALRAYLST